MRNDILTLEGGSHLYHSCMLGGISKAKTWMVFITLALLGAFSSPLAAVEAPSLVVTIAADTVDDMDNQTSLREAVAYAGTLSGADTVTFAPGLNGATIAMTSGTSLSGDVDGITIDATALANGLTIQSNATSRAVLNTGILTLRGLKLTGAALTGGQAGGAVFSSGTLELDRCTLTGNSADFGGGAIFNGGILTVRRCTITGNSSGGHAGAIYNNAGTPPSSTPLSPRTPPEPTFRSTTTPPPRCATALSPATSPC